MMAPIALFVYNRVLHTRQTIEALKKNNLAVQSDLIIFSDGPRGDKDIEKVSDVRQYVATITGFQSIKIFESNVNKGLANSITAGVTSVLQEYESIIVMEDDLVTSPFFLSFMNQALDLYVNDEIVISINGYVYPVKAKLPDSFFLKGADCQGWATWRRGWKIFNPDGKQLLLEIKKNKFSRDFNYNNSYPYTRMLYWQQKGIVDSWAIRWYASAFLQNKLTLYPGVSLLQNIGFDDTGTNSSNWDKKRYETEIRIVPMSLERIQIEQNLHARKAFEIYFRASRKPFLLKIKDKLLSILKRFS